MNAIIAVGYWVAGIFMIAAVVTAFALFIQGEWTAGLMTIVGAGGLFAWALRLWRSRHARRSPAGGRSTSGA